MISHPKVPKYCLACFIDDVRYRVQNTRVPVAPGGFEPTSADGPTLANFTTLRDYWLDEYDWFAEQTAINDKFKQF